MRIELDEKELMRLRRSGMTLKNIANRLGCSRETAGRRLRELGIRVQVSGRQHANWRGGECLGSGGYAMVLQPGHPKADTRGYVRRAILMWEAYHGKPWPEGKVPHHWNEDELDDDPRNVVPLTRSEHSSIHARRRHHRHKQGSFAKRPA